MAAWTSAREFINPWTELEFKTEGVQPPGASEAVFYRNEKTGSYIRFLYVKPGPGTGSTQTLSHDFDEFVYIISGGNVNERLGHRYKAGTFAVFPAGTKHGPLSSPVGLRVIEFRHYLPKGAKRPEGITQDVEFNDPLTSLKWEPTIQPPGARVALAYKDEQSGTYIRFIQNEPGWGEGKKIKTDLGNGACCSHTNFDEIIYLIDGGLYNKRLDCRYEAGSIALMPYGIAHGPMEAPVGAFAIEFRHVIE
jgi:hypothetical protein